MHLPALIERRANGNRWTRCHPGEKVCLAGGLLVVASWHPSLAASMAAGVATLCLLRHVGVTWAELASSASVPAALLAAGALPLAVHVTPAHTWWIGVSPDGAWQGLLLCLRGTSAMLATLLLAFTTPFTDLAWLVARLGAPRAVVEVLLTMHRFLFALSQTMVTMQVAQRARLGFIGWSGHVRAAGQIAGALFGRAIDRAVRLERGLAARGGVPLSGGAYAASPRTLRAFLLALVCVGALALGGVVR